MVGSRARAASVTSTEICGARRGVRAGPRGRPAPGRGSAGGGREPAAPPVRARSPPGRQPVPSPASPRPRRAPAALQPARSNRQCWSHPKSSRLRGASPPRACGGPGPRRWPPGSTSRAASWRLSAAASFLSASSTAPRPKCDQTRAGALSSSSAIRSAREPIAALGPGAGRAAGSQLMSVAESRRFGFSRRTCEPFPDARRRGGGAASPERPVRVRECNLGICAAAVRVARLAVQPPQSLAPSAHELGAGALVPTLKLRTRFGRLGQCLAPPPLATVRFGFASASWEPARTQVVPLCVCALLASAAANG